MAAAFLAGVCGSMPAAVTEAVLMQVLLNCHSLHCSSKGVAFLALIQGCCSAFLARSWPQVLDKMPKISQTVVILMVFCQVLG